MEDKIRNISLIIADRPYKLRIEAHEEENVRKAAKMIKEKLSDLKKSYQAKDKQDYLAMVALMYCVDYLEEHQRKDVINDDGDNKLGELDQILTDFLDN